MHLTFSGLLQPQRDLFKPRGMQQFVLPDLRPFPHDQWLLELLR